VRNKALGKFTKAVNSCAPTPRHAEVAERVVVKFNCTNVHNVQEFALSVIHDGMAGECRITRAVVNRMTTSRESPRQPKLARALQLRTRYDSS